MKIIPMRLALLLVFAGVVLAQARLDAGDGADDAKKLQGAWEVVELIAYGTKIDPKEFQGTRFVFDGNKLTVTPAIDKGKPADKKPAVERVERFVKRTFTFKLDPSKKPAHVDLTNTDDKGKPGASPGIYEIKGDTLRWCQNDASKSTDRPKDFESREKSPFYLVTLKRAK